MPASLSAQWFIQHREELKDAYQGFMPAIEERIRQIRESGRRNSERKLCDDAGTMDDFLNDLLYFGHMHLTLWCKDSENQADAAQKKGWTKIKFMDMQQLEARARQVRKLEAQANPEPEDALDQFLWKDYMDEFSQREAEALILCTALKLTAKEAAVLMRCSEGAVHQALSSAKRRCQDIVGRD